MSDLTRDPDPEAARPCVVMTTAANREQAEMIALAVLESRLAACAQLTPIASMYWWEGRIAREDEVLVTFKTTTAQYAMLEAEILRRHAYDTPEIIQLPIERGLDRYLAWLGSETAPPA